MKNTILTLSLFILAATTASAETFRVSQTPDSRQFFSLIKFESARNAPNKEGTYNRVQDFGRWIADGMPNSCFDTRGAALARDSKKPVSVDKNTCRVTAGEWNDPYTNKLFRKADEMQVDHMVPLKHAYDTGAANWPAEMRCIYANYLGNPFHLISVSVHENTSKGDNGPDQYLPPIKEFHCEYVSRWLKVKHLWNLTLSGAEVAAIRDVLKNSKCQPQQFAVPAQWVTEQRKEIQREASLRCAKFAASTARTHVSGKGK